MFMVLLLCLIPAPIEPAPGLWFEVGNEIFRIDKLERLDDSDYCDLTNWSKAGMGLQGAGRCCMTADKVRKHLNR
jgi:hypothetical protein